MKKPKDFTAYHFETAVLPPKWSICGVELRPFSLGQFVLLKYIHCPMLDDEAEATLENTLAWFFETLLICAATYEDSVAMLNDEALHKKTMDEFTANLLKNIKADPGWNIYEKLRAFREYVDYHMTIPFYTEERTQKDNGAPSGTDWMQNLFLTFKKFGYSESEIFNMSMRQIFYIWCSEAEMQGAIKVMNCLDLSNLARQKGLL